MSLNHKIIYKIMTHDQWQSFEQNGFFEGALVDLEDGYIHFSTASQLSETLSRHFHGQTNLMLVSVEIVQLGNDLRYEPSRGGDLFPHLYAPLPVGAVREITPLPLGPDGCHQFPDRVE